MPPNIKKDWLKWLAGIKSISNFNFARCVVKSGTYRSAEMHVFAYSNHEAYSVICFGSRTYDDGSVSVTFLFGKSKVCLMSRVLMIRHLELVAAALVTRTACSVLQESGIKYERVIYWYDSSATLHLLQNNACRFCIFINSRLAEIRESSCVENWQYCPTNLNPSDGVCA